jgi:hypothetical protein
LNADKPRTKGIPVKKFLLLALCLLFAAGAADARTLYVNAKRPNNNGNGLKPATAKRTIQAAINIAEAGNTILVYPGNYAPIETNNRRITIKSVKGAQQTKIVHDWGTLALLGTGKNAKGKNTLLTGFLLDGRTRSQTVGVSGGTLKSCFIQRLVGSGGGIEPPGVYHATLTDCTFRDNDGRFIENSILNRCKILGNTNFEIGGSRLCNCLVAGNEGWSLDYRCDGKRSIDPSLFESSTLVNCTIAGNLAGHYTDEIPVLAYKSRFYNCIFRNNCSRAETWEGKIGKTSVHNADTAKVYRNTYSHTYTDNRNPKFADAANNNYRLAKGSPCIDRGVINATLREWLGAIDLRGRQRVKGKAIDMGCYEY